MTSKAMAYKKVPRINCLPANQKKMQFSQNLESTLKQENYGRDSRHQQTFKNLIVTTTEYSHDQAPDKFINAVANFGGYSEEDLGPNDKQQTRSRQKSIKSSTSNQSRPGTSSEDAEMANLCGSQFCKTVFLEKNRLNDLCNDYRAQIKILKKKSEDELVLYKVELNEKYQKANQNYRDDQRKIFAEKLAMQVNETKQESENLIRENGQLELKLKQALDQISKIKENLEVEFRNELNKALIDKEREMNLEKMEQLRAQKNQLLAEQKAMREQMKQTFSRELNSLQKEYNKKVDSYKTTTNEMNTQTDEKITGLGKNGLVGKMVLVPIKLPMVKLAATRKSCLDVKLWPSQSSRPRTRIYVSSLKRTSR